MIRNIRDMIGFRIVASDGDAGRVEDFFFDDESWTVRYLVDRNGTMLAGKELLISPASFDGAPEWYRKIFPVCMTREKVMRSPDVDTHKPVSRRKELEILSYYGSPVYWQFYASQTVPPIPVTPPIPENAFEKMSEKHASGGADEEEPPEDVHLRSVNEVTGYAIQAEDGTVGGLRTMLVDDSSWEIKYIVADTNSWLPGGNVRVNRNLVGSVSWADRAVSVRLTVEALKGLARYDPAEKILT